MGCYFQTATVRLHLFSQMCGNSQQVRGRGGINNIGREALGIGASGRRGGRRVSLTRYREATCMLPGAAGGARN